MTREPIGRSMSYSTSVRSVKKPWDDRVLSDSQPRSVTVVPGTTPMGEYVCVVRIHRRMVTGA